MKARDCNKRKSLYGFVVTEKETKTDKDDDEDNATSMRQSHRSYTSHTL